jgi:hypothetical protein
MKTLMLVSMLALTAGVLVAPRPVHAGWVVECGSGYDYCQGCQYGYYGGNYQFYCAYRYGYCPRICKRVWR